MENSRILKLFKQVNWCSPWLLALVWLSISTGFGIYGYFDYYGGPDNYNKTFNMQWAIQGISDWGIPGQGVATCVTFGLHYLGKVRAGRLNKLKSIFLYMLFYVAAAPSCIGLRYLLYHVLGQNYLTKEFAPFMSELRLLKVNFVVWILFTIMIVIIPKKPSA